MTSENSSHGTLHLTEWLEEQKQRANERIDDDRVGDEETLRWEGERSLIDSLQSYLEVGVLTTERYAKVNVIAPDGSVEDSVKVQFGYEQSLGIDPLEWTEKGYFGNEYKLELVYIVADGKHYFEDEVRPLDTENEGGSDGGDHR